jgi:hypothetical protein
MAKDESLLFLKSKIQQINYAIFKAEMHTEHQLPNNIISTIKSDDEGNIWFFTSFTGTSAQYIDQHFFAYLDYYKKGGECRLRLNGRATIVPDEDYAAEAQAGGDVAGNANLVMIKFKILHAEYIENKPTEHSSVKDKLKTFFSEIFIAHSHRVYDFT